MTANEAQAELGCPRCGEQALILVQCFDILETQHMTLACRCGQAKDSTAAESVLGVCFHHRRSTPLDGAGVFDEWSDAAVMGHEKTGCETSVTCATCFDKAVHQKGAGRWEHDTRRDDSHEDKESYVRKVECLNCEFGIGQDGFEIDQDNQRVSLTGQADES